MVVLEAIFGLILTLLTVALILGGTLVGAYFLGIYGLKFIDYLEERYNAYKEDTK